MKVYKISIKNDDLADANLPDLHFQEQRTAEAVMNVFKSLLNEGKTLDFECEVIDVLSHEEALEQFLSVHFSGNSAE